MIEATLVYPFIILAVAATMMILSFLLVEGISQINLHQCIREEAGKSTGTTKFTKIQEEDYEHVMFNKSIGGFHSILNGQQVVELNGAGLLPRIFRKTIEGHLYLVDEQKYIRYMDLFAMKEAKDEE